MWWRLLNKEKRSQEFIKTVYGGNIENISYWLDGRVDINGRELFSQDSALHVVCGEQNIPIVKLLLQRSIDINSKNFIDKTPLHIVAKNGNMEILDLLLSFGANVNVQDNTNKTPLHIAVEMNNLDMVKKFISYKAKLDMQDGLGKTALHIAAENKNFDIFKLLVSNGADIRMKDKWGKTVLHIASMNGCKNIVKFAIAKGVNVNERDNLDNDSVYLAGKNGNADILKILLDNGATVNTYNLYENTTALYEAAKNGDSKSVELLTRRDYSNNNIEHVEIIEQTQKIGEDMSIVMTSKCRKTQELPYEFEDELEKKSFILAHLNNGGVKRKAPIDETTDNRVKRRLEERTNEEIIDCLCLRNNKKRRLNTGREMSL